MGLEKNSGAGSKTYLNIMFGKLVRRAKKDDAGAVSRENKKGETVWEEHFDSLEGFITSITIRRNDEYGDELKITFDEGGKEYIVGIQTRSGYGKGFFRKMLNIDYNNPVKIAPYLIENEDGKSRSFLGVYQGSAKIESFYTKDNPNGLPQLEKTTFKGREAWDDTKQMKFLEKELATKVIPMIEAAVSSITHSVPNDLPIDKGTGGMADDLEVVDKPVVEDIPDDDLPF